MDYIPRHIDTILLDWKNDRHRKPLLLRGARQVGKSSSVRHLGSTFKYYLEVNLEKRQDLIQIFRTVSDVHEIAQRLSLLTEVPIVAGDTLLFIDEIQMSIDAIRMLRYFKEEYPELHVIAAGSLLEFALADMASFGVGRITSIFMYPLSFKEFLNAGGHDQWIEALDQCGVDNPLFDSLHANMIEELRSFLLVGGMPACVALWLETNSYLKCQEFQEDILQSYIDDFAKYSSKANPELLRAVLRSVISQSGKKFVYSRGITSAYRTAEIKEALQMLSRAGLIYKISMTSANGLPLGAETNPKFMKYCFLDTGLMLRAQSLVMGDDTMANEFIISASTVDLVNKGSIAEMVVGLELIKNGKSRLPESLFYWENTSRGATAEVDFVVPFNMTVLPIDVKSGVSGKMKSLRLFMENKSLSTAIRTSLENFGHLDIDNGRTINIIPIYAIYNYRNYLT